MFESVAGELGGELVGFEQLTGGVSATVYALDLRVGSHTRRVVYRQYPPTDFTGHEPESVTTEFGVLQSLHAAGFAVAKPLLLNAAGQFLVTEFIEGTTTVRANRLSDALDQMVDFLVALHAFNPSALAATPPELEDPLTSSLRYLPDTPTGERARSALASTALVANRPVVIHGDYWPGNVLWHEGQLAAVIDWEDTHVGDPLADLACARVELLCEYGDDAMEYFTGQYLARGDVAMDSLSIWEIYVSASALTTMHLWELDKAEEARRRSQTTAFFERAVSRTRS